MRATYRAGAGAVAPNTDGVRHPLGVSRRAPWRAPCALAAVVLTSLMAPARAATPAAGSGCHPEWPRVAHLAGGRRVGPGATGVACVSRTGFATSEPSLVVANSGAIVFSPAHTENSVAVSSDRGRSGHLAYPNDEQYTALWNTDDPYLTVDRRTGRVFWSHATGPLRTVPLLVAESPLPADIPLALAAASGFQVYATNDDGHSWRTSDNQLAPVTDWEKIFVGPPTKALAGAQRGYPDVVYLCGNSPIEAVGPGRLCYRSRDGGVTFAPVSYIFPSPAAPAGCPAVAANDGVVASDGTVFQPVSCTGGSWVAISGDEGGTYRWVKVPGAPGNGTTAMGPTFQIAVDGADTLYASWVANGQLLMSVSRNAGVTWSAGVDITAPGTSGVTLPQLTAGSGGAVGVVYYARARRGDPHLSAYITQTHHALDARPVWESAALNDPAHPIFVDNGLTGGSPRADYIGAGYDRGGILWAGVVEQLGAPDKNGHVETTGYVGRLEPA